MVNKQRFSMWIGLAFVVFHLGLCAYLWQLDVEPGVSFLEISLPITAAYCAAIVGWFVVNQGIVRDRKRVGLPYVLLILVLTGAFVAGLIYVPVSYARDHENFDLDTINLGYAALESSVGVLFAKIFADLFAVPA